MPSNSYLSLLVLVLAVSTVSPVRCAETQYVTLHIGHLDSEPLDVSNSSGRQIEIEDRGSTSSALATGSRHRARGGPGLAILGLGLTGVLLVVALVNTFDKSGGKKPSPTRPKPPTNTTQPTSPPRPNNPPRAFLGRVERDFGRGLPADTSSKPYPNLHLDDIADGVFTTAGSSEARSIDIQDG